MPNIAISISDKTAYLLGNPVIVCGNSDYIVTFTFDGEWDAYNEKTARFNFQQNGVRRYYEVLFAGDTVAVPALYDISDVEIGVYAGDIRTSTGARVPCAPCITDGAAQHPDPPPDVYDQLLEYLAGLQGGGTSVTTAVPALRAAIMGTVTAAASGGAEPRPYLQATGSQGVLCGFTPSSTNIRYVCTFADFVRPTSGWSYIFGGYSFDANNARPGGLCCGASSHGGNLVVGVGNGERFTGVGFPSGRHTYTVTISGNNVELDIDGLAVADSWSGSLACPVGLCAAGSASGLMEYGQVKIYGFQIYENGTLVRDFVPALDGETPAFYERVSGTYYPSITGTDFVYGIG